MTRAERYFIAWEKADKELTKAKRREKRAFKVWSDECDRNRAVSKRKEKKHA